MLSEKEKTDITIVVTTCSKYSDLWNNYVFLLDKFWPNHPDVVFISDGKPDDFETFPYTIYVESGDYSFRLKSGLSNIKSRYVLLTLDDYLISGPVNYKEIQSLVQLMDLNDIKYCRLFHRAKTKPWFNKSKRLRVLPLKRTCYEVNLYTSIWEKTALSNLIKFDENPWKFEVRLTRRSKESGYKCISCIDLSIYPFVDTIRKGKYLRKAYKFLKKNNLFISNRKVRSRLEEFKLLIRTTVSDLAPAWLHSWYNKKAKTKPYSYYANNDE